MSAVRSNVVGVDGSFVQVVADTINAKDFHSQNAVKVAITVNEAIREILTIAGRFQRLGRRRQLTPEDLDCAIRLKGITPPFGYETGSQPSFKYAGNLVRDMFVKEDHEIDLQSFIQAPLPRLPLAPSLKAHWLVIDGEQPAIPENPQPEKPKLMPVQNLPSTSMDESPLLLKQLGKNVRKITQVQIKTISTHPISLEQQVFFKEVMEAAMGTDDNKRNEALSVIQTDCGIQLLLPRFSLAVAEGVRCNVALRNLAFLIYHMRVLQSLANNKTVNLEGVLHEILPAILTCILSKTLCPTEKDNNNWVLRNFSSKLLATIYKQYTSTNVRIRIVKVLADAVRNSNNSITTIAAAATSIAELGNEVMQATLLPLKDQLQQIAQRILRSAGKTTDNQVNDDRSGAEKLLDVLKKLSVIDGFDDLNTSVQFERNDVIHRRLLPRMDNNILNDPLELDGDQLLAFTANLYSNINYYYNIVIVFTRLRYYRSFWPNEMRRLILMLLLRSTLTNGARSEFDMGIARAAPSWNPEAQERTTKEVRPDSLRFTPPTTPTTPPLPPIDPDEEFQGGGNLIIDRTDPVNLLTTTTYTSVVLPKDPLDTNDVEPPDPNDNDDYRIPSVLVVITDEPPNPGPEPLPLALSYTQTTSKVPSAIHWTPHSHIAPPHIPSPQLHTPLPHPPPRQPPIEWVPPPVRRPPPPPPPPSHSFAPPEEAQPRPPEPTVHVHRPVITRIRPPDAVLVRYTPRPTYPPRPLNLLELNNVEDTVVTQPPTFIVVTTTPTTTTELTTQATTTTTTTTTVATTTQAARKKMSGQFPTRQTKPPPPRPIPFEPVPPEALFYHGGPLLSRYPERNVRYVPVHYRIPVFRPPPLYGPVYQYYQPVQSSYRQRGQSRLRRRFITTRRNMFHQPANYRQQSNPRSYQKGAVK
ncbi:unnamed protein product [Bursaphelenchus okinawaensis]|uniref:Transcription initiation factor TFIID subunit 6 n=1 Tax=Bursaphelenchus okinawaensis TaxID=465554 RepID=A0A811LN01_9BILA|nr:unnamed protein product [Bursaphelenchus okinawaensis]CAG9125819.1 unnamed protein product [Bursaphelenchus okinawaensis]